MQPIHLKSKTGFKSLVATYPLAGRRVMRAGARVHLGPIEYRLLCTFMERPGQVFSRQRLLDLVWGRDIYVGRGGSVQLVLKGYNWGN